MKTRTFTFTLMAVLLAFSGSAIAAPKICDDGSRPPCDGGGDGAAPDFGDLIKLYRDDDGVPYLTADGCWQPLPSDLCDTEACELVPGVDGGLPIIDPPLVIPVDETSCAVVDPDCVPCTQEVDFGRMNVARAPASVFEQQLADVIVNLATSDCVVSLDPAGRMVTGTILDDDPFLYSTSAIDSPLQSLAIYRQLMLTGSIGIDLAQGATVLDTAARGLGAASDKGGDVNVDLVAYLNQIMGLSDCDTDTYLDKHSQFRKQEVQGVVQEVEECFLDYGGYGYVREDNFGALPSPAYIPEDVDTAGWFEYLAWMSGSSTVDDPTFEILEGLITTAVFPNGMGSFEPGYTDGNIGGFAQASDDTRAVINFMHDWAIPDADVFATPVPCDEVDGTTYDVSISDVSGLQVPKNYVNGQEREFTVTVANAGPDTAALGTVTVTATADGEIDCDGDDSNCIWTFPIADLAAGESESWTMLFTITTTSDTIDWTALVEAEDDVNADNNDAEATSTVKASGGGGGRP